MNHPPPDTATEQRLHPLSWLFVLQPQLRSLLIPLIALLLFGGRGERYEWLSLLITLLVICALFVVSLLHQLTYRYRLSADAVAIRYGWLHRSRRDIPFTRIHNVGLHQSPLHRLFGVAEVRLESAGSDQPEAQLRVLPMNQALALERLVRHRGVNAASNAAQPRNDQLLALSTAEIVRLGLISNRGLVVVTAAFGVLYPLLPEQQLLDLVERHGKQLYHALAQWHPGFQAAVVLAGVALLATLATMRLLSVALALLHYHGFRLSEAQRRISVERGLLARSRSSVARRRIQAWTLQEGLLHRCFKRRRLRVDTAAMAHSDEHGRTFKELAPIATPHACDALVQRLLPALQWPPPQWYAVATHCWWRLWLPSLWLLPLTAALSLRFGAWSLWLLAWWPWSLFAARRQIERMAYALDEHLVAVRGGWWARWWRFAEIDKLQALQLLRSPLDRLSGTATLWLDTAGASGGLPPLRLRFVPLAEAQTVYAQLSARLARRPLEW